MGGVLGFLEQLGRHDHISIYRPERHPKLIGREFSPVPRLAQWILVANDETCADFVTERRKPVVGEASEHKTDIPPLESVSDVRNALHKEGIVPKVGSGIKRDGSKEDDYRFAKFVGDFDCEIERWIVDGALRTLHPVDNADAIRSRWTRAANGHSRKLREFVKRVVQERYPIKGF